MTQPEITEADRLAAAEAFDSSNAWPVNAFLPVSVSIRQGDCDDEPFVQVIARHRQQAVAEALAARDAEIERLQEALVPFAKCCDQIADDEDGEEWAKFRLLVKDYRLARTALLETK